jgi:hypothetical protein
VVQPELAFVPEQLVVEPELGVEVELAVEPEQVVLLGWGALHWKPVVKGQLPFSLVEAELVVVEAILALLRSILD